MCVCVCVCVCRISGVWSAWLDVEVARVDEARMTDLKSQHTLLVSRANKRERERERERL